MEGGGAPLGRRGLAAWALVRRAAVAGGRQVTRRRPLLTIPLAAALVAVSLWLLGSGGPAVDRAAQQTAPGTPASTSRAGTAGSNLGAGSPAAAQPATTIPDSGGTGAGTSGSGPSAGDTGAGPSAGNTGAGTAATGNTGAGSSGGSPATPATTSGTSGAGSTATGGTGAGGTGPTGGTSPSGPPSTGSTTTTNPGGGPPASGPPPGSGPHSGGSPPPAVSVQPDAPPGLAEGQTVTVSASGFTPDAGVNVTECAVPSPGALACDQSTTVTATVLSDGTMAVADRVWRELEAGGGLVTCAQPGAPDACVVLVDNAREPLQGATAPLSFAPASSATATATPTTNLTSGQRISGSGRYFSPSDSVEVLECAGNPHGFANCDTATRQIFTPSPTGTVTFSYDQERPNITVGGQNVNCARQPCTLAIVNSAHFAQGSVESITFQTTTP